jgi:segregation and condensation protein B
VKREVEALLFASDSPLSLSRLRKMFPDVEASEIKDALAALEAEYGAAGHAFTLVEFGGGWQVATRPEFSPLVEKLLKTRKYTRLSRAGLEVLAIIAYRQPITRLEVDEIRGVQSSGALATLQERNLVTVVGRSEALGHPLLYGTTREFLSHLGLKGLSQLPDLPTLEEVVENREDLRAFASQFGEELSDEDFETLSTPPELEDGMVLTEAAPDDDDAADAEDLEVEIVEVDAAPSADNAPPEEQDDDPEQRA